MKIILTMILSLSSSAAFAADFKCTKQVSTARVDTTSISSWPFLKAQIATRECSSDGPNGLCHVGIVEQIASPFEVCYQKFDVKQECQINETANSVSVHCGGVATMEFVLGPDSIGSLQCLENGISRKTWDLGKCVSQ